MQNYFEKTNISLYHDFIFLNVKFYVAVACSRSLESGVRREVEVGKRGREVGIPYPTPPPRGFSYCHHFVPEKAWNTLKWL